MKCKFFLVLLSLSLSLSLSNISAWAAYRVNANIPGTIPNNPDPGLRYAYDPTLLCEDGNPMECTSGSFKIWAHAGWAGQSCIDNIGYYLPLAAGDGYAWQSPWTFLCDATTKLCPETEDGADVFAGPDLVKSGGKQFLVFSHGSADVYNGRIQFAYRNGDTGAWNGPYSLFWISTDNIRGCGCFGGFARVAAVDMPATQVGLKSYIYFYFEVWRDDGFAPDPHCPTRENDVIHIGHQSVFLARVEKKSTAPFLKIENGGAQVYIRNLGQWVNMETHVTHQEPPTQEGFDFPSLSDGYIFGWYPYGYPGFADPLYYEQLRLAGLSLGDVTKYSVGDGTNPADNRYLMTLSFANGTSNVDCATGLCEAYTVELVEGKDPGPWDPIQDFATVASLTKHEVGLSTPTLYKGGLDACGRPWFYMGYGHILESNYANARSRLAKVVPALRCLPFPPVIKPIFKHIITLYNQAYMDADGDGMVDADLLVSMNLLNEVGYEELNIVGLQEEGYPFLSLTVGCHQKKNGKVVCSSEESDLPGLLVDMENRRLYLRDGFFEAGETVDLQIILRTYDKEKDDKDKVKKPKQCKKEDKCVRVKIRVVD